MSDEELERIIDDFKASLDNYLMVRTHAVFAERLAEESTLMSRTFDEPFHEEEAKMKSKRASPSIILGFQAII